MAADAIQETIKPHCSASGEDLPVTTSAKGAGGDQAIGLRRRMSSFSARVQPLSSSSSEALRRGQSMPSVKALEAAGALPRWWVWGLDCVVAPFARELLERSGDEAAAIGGCHRRGAWRHVVDKVRAAARRVLGRDGSPHLAAQDLGVRLR